MESCMQDKYSAKRLSASDIAERVLSGSTLASTTALGLPPAIVEAIAERALNNEIHDVVHYTIVDMPYARFYEEDVAKNYSGRSWFSSNLARKAVNHGYADIMPAYYRDVPDLYRKYVDLDFAVLTVSKMDDNGFFSVGTSASEACAIIEKANHVYLEVNKYMPYVPNSYLISIDNIDGFCENHTHLMALHDAEIDPVSQKIGDFIAERIPDGACIQLGIGAVPNAVGHSLMDRKHLGIHTEMLTSSMVALLKSGAVDNSMKEIHTGNTVAAFALGSHEMYEYMDHNENIEMLAVDYVNNPYLIGRISNFVSINAAIEVDFFGQVCAESVGTRHISGTGGQADFVRGANLSSGGQSFIALPSTTPDGKNSRIRPTLTPGAIISTTKNDVDMIVTEYGVAKLRGQSLSTRVQNLIKIAHPDFRDELEYEAKKLGWV